MPPARTITRPPGKPFATWGWTRTRFPTTARPGDRVFLDANVLFSAAWRKNAGLFRLWQSSDTTLLTSRYAFEEARRNLETEEQRRSLATLMVEIQLVPDRVYGDFPPGIFLPEKDRPILLAAIEAQATHLLTGDKRHFGSLYGRCISGVHTLRPADYLGAL